MKIRKKTWRHIVAAMVVAAVAGIGASKASAQDINFWRSDTSVSTWMAPNAWTDADDNPLDEPGVLNNAQLYGAFTTDGAIKLTGDGETVKNLGVIDSGWGLDGTLKVSEYLQVDATSTTDASLELFGQLTTDKIRIVGENANLTLKDGSLTTINSGDADAIFISRGTLISEAASGTTGAGGSATGGVTISDGGTWSFQFSDAPTATTITLDEPVLITGTGGTIHADDDIKLEHFGRFEIAENSTYTKTGTGDVLFFGEYKDYATSVAIFEGRVGFDDVEINGTFTAPRLSTSQDLTINGTVDLTGMKHPTAPNERYDAGDIGNNLILNKDSTLKLGVFDNVVSGNAVTAVLGVNGDYVSKGGTLQLSVDQQGRISALEIKGTASIDQDGESTTIVMNRTVNTDANLNALGAKLAPGENAGTRYGVALVTASHTDSAQSDAKAFQMDGFYSTKYLFSLYKDGGVVLDDQMDQMSWYATADVQTGGLPSLSSMFLVNIIGFDLPRAQNVSGPWVRVKGGHVYDDASNLNNTSYQVMQIGWDKSFKAANGNGEWYSGIFLEGDWMYSKGDYKLRTGNNPDGSYKYASVGNAKASNRGMGVGLYVSRSFDSGWYFDMIGRLNIYESKNDAMDATSGSGYKASWTDKMFALGMEIGKSFTSRDKRWTLNPYERVIYNSTPGNEFRMEFNTANTNDTLVRNRSVDAWTNQLGAMLAYNSLDRDGNILGNVFIKGEYFRGLSGNFVTEARDIFSDKTYGEWKNGEVGRKKNDLDYGNLGVGAMYKPRASVVLSAQTDFLFGDVSGWSVTFGGRYSY